MFSSSISVFLSLTIILVSKAEMGTCQNYPPYSREFDGVYPPVDPTAYTTPLYFGLVVGAEAVENSSLVTAAARLSLDTINVHSNTLRGYSLHYTLTYSDVRDVGIAKPIIKHFN